MLCKGGETAYRRKSRAFHLKKNDHISAVEQKCDPIESNVEYLPEERPFKVHPLSHSFFPVYMNDRHCPNTHYHEFLSQFGSTSLSAICHCSRFLSGKMTTHPGRSWPIPYYQFATADAQQQFAGIAASPPSYAQSHHH